MFAVDQAVAALGRDETGVGWPVGSWTRCRASAGHKLQMRLVYFKGMMVKAEEGQLKTTALTRAC
jgi:hypothetical protein